MPRLFFLLQLVLFISCNSSPEGNADAMESPDMAINLDSLTHELTAISQSGPINGFGVVIADRHGIRYSNGFGYADKASGKVYTQNTIQNIGSVSKTLIGIALLKAGELGHLRLDDPVNKYLPFEVVNPHYPKIPITVRQLTTHTSTILDTDHYDEKSYILNDDADLDKFDLSNLGETFNPAGTKTPMGDFLKKLLAKDGEWYSPENYLEREPGALFEYSNVGATLAAYIIERATGQAYDQFTRQHILQPLGMKASGWSFEEVELAQHSTLYASPEVPIPKYALITYPDGGLLTSSHDMGLYLSELIKGNRGTGTLLSRKSYEEYFTKQLTAEHLPGRDAESIYNDEYNIGVFMGFSAKGYVGHTGGDPGIASYMFFSPETGLGKFLMINTSVRSQEGVDQFYGIWGTLEKYENKLKQ